MLTVANQQKDEVRPRALREKDAARYIGMSPAFLKYDRVNGTVGNRTPAPPYIKAGRAVRYLIEDLDKWLAERRVSR